MKANRSSILALLFLGSFFITSCADNDKGEEPRKGAKDTKNQSINEWIYDEMSFQYFWNEKLAKSSSLNYNLFPKDFFYGLLYRDEDRFSTLENNGVTQYEDIAASNKPQRDIGFEYIAYHDEKTNRISFAITYIKEGSNAKNQGLKRGDWIEKVNGGYITLGNFRTILYTGQSSYNLEFENRAPIVLQVTNNYAENPIYFKNIFRINNKKIGYIIYNFFANDADDKTMQYAIEMNSVMRDFESAKIDELILDLRYNGGGLVESGNYIASAIVPNRNATGTTIYTKRAFNKKYDEYLRKTYSQEEYKQRTTEFFHDYIAKGRVSEEIPKLNMKRLYVITSRGTASASEQIINGLKPYIQDIVIIGETTTGKNMESFAIEDRVNKENKWVLHALTSVSYNSSVNAPEGNNYSGGFKPTSGNAATEFTFYQDSQGNLKPNAISDLGDPDERLLSMAIEHITKNKTRAKRSLAAPTRTLTAIGSSLDRKQKHMIIENQEVKK